MGLLAENRTDAACELGVVVTPKKPRREVNPPVWLVCKAPRLVHITRLGSDRQKTKQTHRLAVPGRLARAERVKLTAFFDINGPESAVGRGEILPLLAATPKPLDRLRAGGAVKRTPGLFEPGMIRKGEFSERYYFFLTASAPA
ncbi:hypothetical protein EBX31_06450 [bacterium]|nr:hypothetical protein [bacterium]